MPSADERHFASDNYAGAHPEVIAAIAEANRGHVSGYGDDPYTAQAEAAMRALVGPEARTFFAFNGTGANVVALAAALRPYEAVICAAGAHIDVDECGAFERFCGAKLLTAPVIDGKLTPDDIERRIGSIGNVHNVQPAAVSISQSTEVGTVYTLDELRALGASAKRHGLLFHVDGARIANAAVALGVDFRTMLTETGVDVFTFGGTKNGLLFGDAIVFTHAHPAAERVPYTRKQGMQLASKMRFVAAQFLALFDDDLWRRNAEHANAMARRLADRLAAIPAVRLAHPVQANGVFAIVPPGAIAALQAERRFYVWDARGNVVRWMAAWDTQPADVDAFADAVARITAA